ncbi:MAG: alpha/beta hydrolase-fold protein [Planctomycetota bacterium]
MLRGITPYALIFAIAGTLAATPQSTPEATQTSNAGLQFEVKFTESAHPGPFTGRVYVIMTSQDAGDPKDWVSWYYSPPLFARDVKNWQPGEKMIFSADNCLAHEVDLAELPQGHYSAQAVMDVKGWNAHPIDGTGNGYSRRVDFRYTPPSEFPVLLKIAHKQTAPKYEEEDLKLVSFRSPLLSKFHKCDISLRALVGLPQTYSDDPQRRFPTLYLINGYAGELTPEFTRMMMALLSGGDFDPVIVNLEAECPTGHHAFADSATNGPVGTALVTEFIPHLEKTFRLLPHPNARYLTGGSSGGWSSLWLQVTYPDFFGGTWSTSPDPVDFTAFMRINIYDPEENMFTQPDGAPWSLTRGGYEWFSFTAQELSDLEEVLGRGGQLASFEAVFSPRGPQGTPIPLWDRGTGHLDPAVAQAWRKYDIRHIIETQWNTLGPKLEHKLFLYCGDQDTFYLERAFFKLRDTLKKLGSDAHIVVIPDASHFLPPRVYAELSRDMAKHYKRHGPKQNQK